MGLTMMAGGSKARGWISGLVGGLVFAGSSPLFADGSYVQAESQAGREVHSEPTDRAPNAATGLVFVPRSKRGAPAARVGGGSRAAGEALEVRALVPEFDDAALTLIEQPKLYWDLSADTDYAVSFTLIDPDAIDPLVSVTLPGPFRAGIQGVELRDYDARLALGKRYQWFVAVMPNPERRSADMIARGSVVRIEPSKQLTSQLVGQSPAEAAVRLARAGIWYDALDAASAGLDERSPAAALALRSALLEQVGLD
jgi:hypothetical protein